MKLFRATALALFIAGLSACATSHDGSEQRGGPAALQQPGRLLAMARQTQAKKGCAKAIPSYRVISSYGDGYDIAQYELGACLLKINSINAAEASLLHEEAMFWLRRAAWAGNARAQLKLAEILSGEKITKLHTSINISEAMGWAIIYSDNPARGLYDLPPVSNSVMAHLHATLTISDTKNAETFAKDFEVIKMASFTPPKMKGKNGRHQERGQGRPQGRPDGQRRRR